MDKQNQIIKILYTNKSWYHQINDEYQVMVHFDIILTKRVLVWKVKPFDNQYSASQFSLKKCVIIPVNFMPKTINKLIFKYPQPQQSADTQSL